MLSVWYWLVTMCARYSSCASCPFRYVYSCFSLLHERVLYAYLRSDHISVGSQLQWNVPEGVAARVAVAVWSLIQESPKPWDIIPQENTRRARNDERSTESLDTTKRNSKAEPIPMKRFHQTGPPHDNCIPNILALEYLYMCGWFYLLNFMSNVI